MLAQKGSKGYRVEIQKKKLKIVSVLGIKLFSLEVSNSPRLKVVKYCCQAPFLTYFSKMFETELRFLCALLESETYCVIGTLLKTNYITNIFFCAYYSIGNKPKNYSEIKF